MYILFYYNIHDTKMNYINIVHQDEREIDFIVARYFALHRAFSRALFKLKVRTYIQIKRLTTVGVYRVYTKE